MVAEVYDIHVTEVVRADGKGARGWLAEYLKCSRIAWPDRISRYNLGQRRRDHDGSRHAVDTENIQKFDDLTMYSPVDSERERTVGCERECTGAVGFGAWVEKMQALQAHAGNPGAPTGRRRCRAHCSALPVRRLRYTHVSRARARDPQCAVGAQSERGDGGDINGRGCAYPRESSASMRHARKARRLVGCGGRSHRIVVVAQEVMHGCLWARVGPTADGRECQYSRGWLRV
ncbi:hypothetical protein FIBSPDRAFT_225986 [Athelia psychrophila]|uniref:Uncharacterized protein n=1 Tax=Athelia psychrophila TaxID=1759441 RepID=A0A166S889_9AGAM|nr:hypothetical protein FIBSPDRAFT_225986 [Fibularhizoctonia sp. CBS 109695]